VEPFPFVVVQTTGLLFVVGMWCLHLLIENWNLSNEWPHLLSGLLIAFGPYVRTCCRLSTRPVAEVHRLPRGFPMGNPIGIAKSTGWGQSDYLSNIH
jgi:hypothetical protein